MPFKTSYHKMFPFMRSPACRLGILCTGKVAAALNLILLSLYLIKDTLSLYLIFLIYLIYLFFLCISSRTHRALFLSVQTKQAPLANQKTDQTSKQSDALLNHTSSAAFALIQIKKIIKTFLCIILIQRWNNQENYWIV